LVEYFVTLTREYISKCAF